MIQLDNNNAINPASSFHRLSNFRVESLLIQNTGTFSDQYLRPYVTNSNLNNNDLTALSTAIIDKAVTNQIDGFTMAGIGNNFLTRSSEAIGNAVIPNGWGSQRAQFIMKISMINSLGMSNPCFVTGYTDHPGINPGTHSIDPRMLFIVNSITQARVVQMRSPVGMTEHMSSVGTQQLFVDTSNSIMNSNYGSQQQFMMRPDDIFRTIVHAPMYQNTDDPLNSNQINDTTIRLDNKSKSGAKRINTAANYLADVVNSYVNAPYEEGTSSAAMAMKYYRNTNNFEKTDIWKNDFFNAISNKRTGYSTAAYGNSFTFSDLQAVDPNVLNTITFVDTQQNELHHAGQTNHWQGTDISTVGATILASSVPALMTEQLISKLIFKSTNNTIDGQPRTDIIYGGGFDSTLDMRQYYENFKKLFEIMVLNDITFNNQLPYFIEMKVDLSGESWIKIKIDNEPFLEYVTPTFCDALFSPIITSRLDGMIHTSNDLETLIQYVDDARTENKSFNYTGFTI